MACPVSPSKGQLDHTWEMKFIPNETSRPQIDDPSVDLLAPIKEMEFYPTA